MINFNRLDPNLWIRERITQSFKSKNIEYIKTLNNVIENSISDLSCDGTIFYKNGDSLDDIKGKYFCYNYGSPAPWLCKFLPDGYGFTRFEPNDIYKKCEPEHGIQSKLLSLYDKGLFTRYPQPKQNPSILLPDNYILVSMQNTGSTVWYRKNFTNLANEINAWSRENKRNIIFKWHNGCIDHSNPERWFSELQEHSPYSTIDYQTPLSTLIKNCDMMWTASSMSGIEALICNKPVSIFGVTEYMEMTTVCDSPEKAVTATVPLDLEQWLTYYVKKYCINIYAKDATIRIRNRVLNHFEKGLSLDEIILL